MITSQFVEEALVHLGYHVCSIKAISEGSNHYVFDTVVNDNENIICKFAKQRTTEKQYQTENTDTMYNGPLSLERESALLRIAREQGHIPAPKILEICTYNNVSFILMEKSPGVPFLEYLRCSSFTKDSFCDSLYHLGQDFAKLHNLQYESYGNLISEKEVYPEGIDNFADYYCNVAAMHLDRAFEKGVFSQSETDSIRRFIDNSFNHFRPLLSREVNPPTYVITDMHANNYFVDKNGIPSGYFDVESAQAAPGSFEFYGFELFLFNMFDAKAQVLGRNAFYKGYSDEKGRFPLSENNPQELIDFFSSLRLLELAQSYWGYIDGIRDTWGEKFKSLFLLYQNNGTLDYLEIGNLFRQRDNIPNHLR